MSARVSETLAEGKSNALSMFECVVSVGRARGVYMFLICCAMLAIVCRNVYLSCRVLSFVRVVFVGEPRMLAYLCVF